MSHARKCKARNTKVTNTRLTINIEVCTPIRGATCKKATRMGGLFTSNGAGERSRTPDLRITNALLYQLSYTG